METRLIGLEQEIIVGLDRPTILIGERINPTGRKRLTQALKEGDLGLLEREARAQAMEGADIIDVNVAGEGIDEEALLPRAVQIVEEATGVAATRRSPQTVRMCLLHDELRQRLERARLCGAPVALCWENFGSYGATQITLPGYSPVGLPA